MRRPGTAAVVLIALAAALLALGVDAKPARHERRARHEKPAPYGPFPSGELDVRIRSDVPLSFCEVTLSRDGTIVRRGKPDTESGTLAFDRLAPGHYDLSAVCRSFVPHGPTPVHASRRVPVWMRNGRADLGLELKVKKKEKPEAVELRMQWSRPVEQVLIRD